MTTPGQKYMLRVRECTHFVTAVTKSSLFPLHPPCAYACIQSIWGHFANRSNPSIQVIEIHQKQSIESRTAMPGRCTNIAQNHSMLIIYIAPMCPQDCQSPGENSSSGCLYNTHSSSQGQWSAQSVISIVSVMPPLPTTSGVTWGALNQTGGSRSINRLTDSPINSLTN